MKNIYEIRDPIHAFVRLDPDERRLVKSEPFQRLRQIHQLSMSYLVYPGATHKRFEHSLGVMELATRIFDVVTSPHNLIGDIRSQVPQVTDDSQLQYWRRVLRFAALLHDIGHLPFSHAAERELLPDGWNHERLSAELIVGEILEPVWESLAVPVRPDDVAQLAVGRTTKGTWEALLSEIIVGDVFGADRMDYLLRDSHHAGVAYGRFDQYRLIDTLRILSGGSSEESAEPVLGVEEGGIQSAEALLLARYFMYSQVYFHHVRRIYDKHLQDFLTAWLEAGKFSIDLGDHLAMTDSEVLSGINSAARDSKRAGHDAARRIVCRDHFRRVYQRHPADLEKTLEPGKAIETALVAEFGPDVVRRDSYIQRGGLQDFPVLTREDRIASSVAMSTTLQQLPVVAVDFVFVDADLQEKALKLIDEHRDEYLTVAEKQELEEEAEGNEEVENDGT
jgi:HD superfamily phosphohydrolase